MKKILILLIPRILLLEASSLISLNLPLMFFFFYAPSVYLTLTLTLKVLQHQPRQQRPGQLMHLHQFSDPSNVQKNERRLCFINLGICNLLIP